MRKFLVFTLVAPMGSFGGLAGHERRGSGEWPARSSVLGLVGAAVGVRRSDRVALEELAKWRVAVSVLCRGSKFRDFHTVQTVPTARIKRPATRRDALMALDVRKDNPLVTRRDYRCDCAFGVALWGGAGFVELIRGLSQPCFSLYLGRKSCPLSAPTAPQLVEETSPVAALGRVKLPPFLEMVDPKRPRLVASDERLDAGWQEIHWDEPMDRDLWHFAPRTVYLCRPSDLGDDE